MEFKITGRWNNGLAEAPPVNIHAADVEHLFENLRIEEDELDVLAHPGGTLTIERVR